MSEHLNSVAISGDGIVIVGHGALEWPVSGVVFEQMGVCFGVGEIVNRDDIKLTLILC